MTCHCGKPVKAKCLCASHYQAEYRARKAAGTIEKKIDPAIFALAKHHKGNGCFICGQPKRAKNLCSAHYFQQRRLTK